MIMQCGNCSRKKKYPGHRTYPDGWKETVINNKYVIVCGTCRRYSNEKNNYLIGTLIVQLPAGQC